MTENKRYIDQLNEFKFDENRCFMPLSLGTIVLSFFCIFLMIVITFTQINLPQIIFMPDTLGNFHFSFQLFPYIIQIPFVVLCASILGCRFSLFFLLVYILGGLFAWPIFSFGGGISYVKTCFFGYILGYLPCMIFTSIIERKFSGFKRALIGGIGAVLLVYLTGFLYSLVLIMFHQTDILSVYSAILSALFGKLPYDILFSCLLLYFNRPIKNFLWLACGNAKKPKKKSKA